MKKITIGRGRDNDVRLSDVSEKVSRKQAFIEVSPLGKMKIHDTSANGTFVNGKRIEKPYGTPIKKGDKINFAEEADLDWSKIKNPYRTLYAWVIAILALAIAGGVVFWLFGDRIFVSKAEEDKMESVAPADSVAPVDDSLTLAIPVETTTLEAAPNTGSTARKPQNFSTEKPKVKESKPEENRIDKIMKDVKDSPQPEKQVTKEDQEELERVMRQKK